MHKYIDADALMEYLKQNWEPINDSFPMSFSLDQIKETLNEMPAADVEPVRHGHWINLGMRVACTKSPTHYCSECGMHGYSDYERCPKCGCKMDGGSEWLNI